MKIDITTRETVQINVNGATVYGKLRGRPAYQSPLPIRHGEKWLGHEIYMLYTMSNRHETLENMARALNRTVRAIEMKLESENLID